MALLTVWRFLAVGVLAGCCLSALATPDLADDYPKRTVRLVVPFGAGGVTDMMARIVANELSASTGQSFVVENRPGADGNIGTGLVAAAPADGYTLLVGSASTNSVNPSLHKSLKFNAMTDFAPITNLAAVSNLLLAGPNVPEQTISALVKRPSEQPYHYASTGAGGTQHLSGELFNAVFKTKLVHVPYKGLGPALQDVIGGRVELFFCNLPACLPHVKDGRLRALGITSAERSALLPNVPTIAEIGHAPDYVVEGWFGLFAPVRTPTAIVQYLNEKVVAILKDPRIAKQMLTQGAEPRPLSTKDFAAFVNAEHARWAKVIRDTGMSLE